MTISKTERISGIAFRYRRLCFVFVSCILSFGLSAQNFSKLHDVDSTADWGHSLFQKKDASFIVVGGSRKNQLGGITWDKFSTNGDTFLSKKMVNKNGASLYIGTQPLGGKVKYLDDRYFVPLSVEFPKPPFDFYMSAGILTLDSNGDAIFYKTYTDTSNFNEYIEDGVPTENGFFLSGNHSPINGAWNSYKDLLLSLDQVGNFKWSKIYSDVHNIQTVQLLETGSLLVGGFKWQPVYVGADLYYKKYPAFMLVDSMNGNVIKNTAYAVGYTGGGSVSKDKNGGYYHWGFTDKIVGSSLEHPESLPAYLSHLDENFQITWITQLVAGPTAHNYIRHVRQLRDSCYLVIGAQYAPGGHSEGWATKVNKKGELIWDNTYSIDKNQHAYLVDGIQLEDGGFAFTGSARSSADSPWHREDIWLLRVDSNGCEIPGCTPTFIGDNKEDAAIVLYPNPTNGAFTFRSKEVGVLYICNLQGQVVSEHSITTKETLLEVPATATPGVYMARFVGKNKQLTVLKLVYHQ